MENDGSCGILAVVMLYGGGGDDLVEMMIKVKVKVMVVVLKEELIW